MKKKIELYPDVKLKFRKRLLLFIIILLVFIRIWSYNTIATYYKFSIDITKEFNEQIIENYEDVKIVEFKYVRGGGLSVGFKLVNALKTKEREEILVLTRELLMTEEFKVKFLRAYFKKYKNHQYYPNIYIDFFVNEISMGQYQSEYYPEDRYLSYDEYSKVRLRKFSFTNYESNKK